MASGTSKLANKTLTDIESLTGLVAKDASNNILTVDTNQLKNISNVVIVNSTADLPAPSASPVPDDGKGTGYRLEEGKNYYFGGTIVLTSPIIFPSIDHGATDSARIVFGGGRIVYAGSGALFRSKNTKTVNIADTVYATVSGADAFDIECEIFINRQATGSGFANLGLVKYSQLFSTSQLFIVNTTTSGLVIEGTSALAKTSIESTSISTPSAITGFKSLSITGTFNDLSMSNFSTNPFVGDYGLFLDPTLTYNTINISASSFEGNNGGDALAPTSLTRNDPNIFMGNGMIGIVGSNIPPFGRQSYDGNLTVTTIVTQGVSVKLELGTIGTSASNADFTLTTSNRLLYNGKSGRHFHIVSNFSVSPVINNQEFTFKWVKNGVTDMPAAATSKASSATDKLSLSLHADDILNNGDYIELWGQCDSGVEDFTVTDSYQFAQGMNT